MSIYYHVSTPELVPLILEKGLLAFQSETLGFPAVYLFKGDYRDLVSVDPDFKGHDLAMFEVELNEFEEGLIGNDPEYGDFKDFAYYYPGDIAPMKIVFHGYLKYEGNTGIIGNYELVQEL